MFSYGFCEISKNAFVHRTHLAAASAFIVVDNPEACFMEPVSFPIISATMAHPYGWKILAFIFSSNGKNAWVVFVFHYGF